MNEATWEFSDEDQSWRFSGFMDPRTGRDDAGDFRTYLMHEFGHWVAAQELGLRVDGVFLYGLTYIDDRILVTKGGGVPFSGKLRGDEWARVVANAAGIVAENLSLDTGWSSESPIGLFRADPTLESDFREIKDNLSRLGIFEEESQIFESKIGEALAEAKDVILPHLQRLREAVLSLERIMKERRSETMEIVWNGRHAGLLTGMPSHHYE